ncbi:MAG TPA: rhodanese-like domain-containing protein [Roseiflexaceae bacterium]|jgi:rhodanese-related sulfurtransferase|nr:rhodanese-like domain-containing protein [Roseiflexaceae bacterium]
MPYHNLTTDEVKARLDHGESFRLIDVREPHEHDLVHIEGAELLPLSQAAQWIGTLPQDEELVFFCHHGGRSQQIAQYLATQAGYTKVANMLGGIDEWARRIDPSLPRY